MVSVWWPISVNFSCKHLNIIKSSICFVLVSFLLIQGYGGAEAYSSCQVQKVGYTFDRSLVYHRANT